MKEYVLEIFNKSYNKIKESLDAIKVKIRDFNNARKYKIYMKRYIGIKPRPFLSHLSLSVMTSLPSSNVVNLENLVNLALDCGDTKQYEELDTVIEEYFNSSVDVHYKDYFIDKVGATSIMVDPVKSWENILSGVFKLNNKKVELENNIYKNPDNYYYIVTLEKTLSVVEKFMVNVYNIETSK